MKLDVMTVSTLLEDVAETARQVEDAGFDGLWFTEVTSNAFLPAPPPLGPPSASISAPRYRWPSSAPRCSPRRCAWELQRASRGRFVLGLGTQVKGHNERRFSVPFAKPQEKLREQVLALQAIYAGFSGAGLDFHGEFYNFDLLPDFFNPGPMAYPTPPTYLAAMSPSAYRMSGEVADGVHIHPLHSARYLAEAAIPAIERAWRRPVAAARTSP